MRLPGRAKGPKLGETGQVSHSEVLMTQAMIGTILDMGTERTRASSSRTIETLPGLALCGR